MPRYFNSFQGIVLSLKDDHMVIALIRGGTIRAPLTEGIRSGEHVAFLMDNRNEHITEVMSKRKADAVVDGSYISDAALNMPISEEEDIYGDHECKLSPILRCYEL